MDRLGLFAALIFGFTTLSEVPAFANRQTVQPFAQLDISLRYAGVAKLSAELLIACSHRGETRVVDLAGNVIRQMDLNVDVNRAPLAFREGGAVIASLARSNEGTRFFFFDSEGNLIREVNLPGQMPGAMTLQPDGTVAATPEGQVVFFDSKGEIVRRIPTAPLRFFLSIYWFPDGRFFSSAGDLTDPYRIQFDSFFNPDGEMVAKIPREVPTFAPAFMNDGTAIIHRWDGELYAASSDGTRLASTSLGDFGTEAPITLDGNAAIVPSLAGLFWAKRDGAVIRTRVIYKSVLNTPLPLDRHRFITSGSREILVLDLRDLLTGRKTPVREFTPALSDGDFIPESVLQLNAHEFIAHSAQGKLFRIRLN